MKKEPEMSEYSGVFEWHQGRIAEEEDVIEAMRYISSHKAQGSDNIHNQMVKNGGQSMIDSLVMLFDWSYSIGYMPKSWKTANIVPIPRSQHLSFYKQSSDHWNMLVHSGMEQQGKSPKNFNVQNSWNCDEDKKK
ncbi:hypothetical protein RFI_00387 [Reticulomyxa filosa]|uniref:Uncharacterized protein n=1 Tax=Reticulomyxa filosa TaxID=46433 RepID=X6PDU1_RETFI|nr:hypothetical protein RFI_00387 [Reticulomyxa filosa]|eukprot:ETO36675.1 hypothetical protein RFI_00387 [Reticulomyxa filosa]